MVKMMANGAIILNLITKKEPVGEHILLAENRTNLRRRGGMVHSPNLMARKGECECFRVGVLRLGKAHQKIRFYTSFCIFPTFVMKTHSDLSI